MKIILTGDIHLTDRAPVARTDNWGETVQRKIDWLFYLKEQYLKKGTTYLLDAGDMFDNARPSNELIAWAIGNLPAFDLTLPGNHDLPGRTLKNIGNTAQSILHEAGIIYLVGAENGLRLGENLKVWTFPWGVLPTPCPDTSNYQEDGISRIAVAHILTWSGKIPWAGIESDSATDLLHQLTGYDLILTGHNHKAFHAQEGTRYLVNPGSIFRLTADEAEATPCVYVWDTDTNELIQEFVPIESGAVTREHIERVEERDARIEAFADHLNKDWLVETSFERNVENYFSRNRGVDPRVKELVYEAISSGK